ncbi:regulatory protein RecX [Chlamydiota bacterium]
MNKNQSQDSLSYALRILSVKDYTEREILKKLMAKVSSESAQKTVEQLKKLGYIDDESYCRKWLEYRCERNPVGKMYAVNKLRTLGIEKNIIETQVNDFYEKNEEIEMAVFLIEKRLSGKDKVDQKTKAKHFRYLMSKGFSRSISMEALNRVVDK